jgi:glucose-1-phosphate cytidylyltransferase
MQVIVLCGGRGMRAYPYTEHLPKPMIPVCGSPILMHVMRIYMDQGHRDFILSVGYRKDVISDYFHRKDLGCRIQCIDTGADTDTGGRILNCREALDGTFMATYADGLADVPMDDLLSFHRAHGGLATITTVPLVSQYGTLNLDSSGRVLAFREKPLLDGHWINAGFFVFEPEVFDYWHGANLEREVFPRLSSEGLLYAYRHAGFFKSLDSYKDQLEIEQIVQQGDAPWRKHARETAPSTIATSGSIAVSS